MKSAHVGFPILRSGVDSNLQSVARQTRGTTKTCFGVPFFFFFITLPHKLFHQLITVTAIGYHYRNN